MFALQNFWDVESHKGSFDRIQVEDGCSRCSVTGYVMVRCFMYRVLAEIPTTRASLSALERIKCQKNED
jgi:hypothetical protein